jgi:hypothetical protein
MTEEKMRALVKECGLDWEKGYAPMIHCGDCSTYRSVQITLTEEQVKALAMRPTHGSRGLQYYEEISRCFIEPDIDGSASVNCDSGPDTGEDTREADKTFCWGVRSSSSS